LIDEEFEGIVHLRTSTFQKRVATARHDFIKLTGSENKLEALLQVNSSLLNYTLATAFPSNPSYFKLDIYEKIQQTSFVFVFSISCYIVVSTIMFLLCKTCCFLVLCLFHSTRSLNENLEPPPFYDKYS
jgi:hypothetical protein